MKVGDRVKSLIIWPNYFAPGDLGTIVGTNSHGFEVEWDNGCSLEVDDKCPGSWWPMFEHEVELYRES